MLPLASFKANNQTKHSKNAKRENDSHKNPESTLLNFKLYSHMPNISFLNVT